MTLTSIRKYLKSIVFGMMTMASGTTLYQTGCGSNLGYGGYYDYYGYYGYVDTSAVQSVIDYRLDAMDWSNDGWDEYIRE